MIEAARQLLRGEPLVLRSLVVAVLAAVGVQVADGTVEAWLAVLAPLVLALITRPAVTPSKNPEVPTTTAVHVDADGVETPAELPPMELPPVRTLTHPRTVR